MTDRTLGDPKAPVTMQEYFSLTCTHCAAWSVQVFPDVKAKLIDTGKVFYIYRDFPLDQVALTAAMVARALPPARYEPFVNALLASQDRWAFARDVNSTEELFKRAAFGRHAPCDVRGDHRRHETARRDPDGAAGGCG